MGIVIARYYGFRNFTKIQGKQVVATWICRCSFEYCGYADGLCRSVSTLAIFRYPCRNPPQPYQYISMIVTCVGVSFAYNLFAGLLRSIGDSLAALGFLIFLPWLMWCWICISLRNCIWEFNPQGLLPSFRKAWSAVLWRFLYPKECSRTAPSTQAF